MLGVCSSASPRPSRVLKEGPALALLAIKDNRLPGPRCLPLPVPSQPSAVTAAAPTLPPGVELPQTTFCCWGAGTNDDQCFAQFSPDKGPENAEPLSSRGVHFCGFVHQLNISVGTLRIDTLKPRV